MLTKKFYVPITKVIYAGIISDDLRQFIRRIILEAKYEIQKL